MNTSALYMSDSFEKQKKTRATAATVGAAGGLLLLAILIKWPIPSIPAPPVEEGIEINLGSSDQGFGTDQPQLPGDPAPVQQVAYTPPQPVQSNTDAPSREVTTDDNETEDVPAVTKPAHTKPDATRITNNTKVVKTTPAPQPPVETPPRPKAVLGRTIGGSGNGGNGAETYQRGGNEGVAGGTGDQGRAGGSPTGRNYTGPVKSFGVRVLQISDQSFEDDFNVNAKVAMEVTADANGKVTSAVYTSKGSSGTATAQMKEIARRRAFELKLGTSDGGQRGTVIFNFKVKG